MNRQLEPSAPPDPETGRAYIFLNGDFEKPRLWPERPAPGDLVIAADGGLRHVQALGWPVHCLVGDFDSLAPEVPDELRSQGAEVLQYPTDKDEIDFELALQLARRRGYARVEVLGALGGRWDMTIGNLFLPRAGWDSEAIRFRHGAWTILAAGGPVTLTVEGRAGDLLSLIPLGEDVEGVPRSGCRDPLAGETLRAGFSRGLSNALTESEARLGFESGTLLVIHREGA
jgi:thiamine pyrophosphokinase